MRFAAFLAFALLAFAGTARAGEPAASVDLDAGRVYPALAGSLGLQDRLFVEISYNSSVPIRLQARGYSSGAAVDDGAMMNASAVYPEGTGTGLVWVAFAKPTLIDEIRVTAYRANWEPIIALGLPAHAGWIDHGAAGPAKSPEWLAGLIQREDQRLSAPASEDAGPAADAVVHLIFLSVPAYFILQIFAVKWLARGLRWASLVPLVVMAPLVAYSLLALAAGSSLWPLLLIFAAPVCVLYLVVVLLIGAARRISWT